MYSNNILNFQESTTILNGYTKNVCKLIECITYISNLIKELRVPYFAEWWQMVEYIS